MTWNTAFEDKPNHFKRLAFAVALSLLLLPCVSGHAQEWTRFRGPNGAGISHIKTVPSKISDADLNWKIELPGSGHSSPVLWDDRIFLTYSGDKAGGISVICLSAKDGKMIWKHDFALSPFAKHSFNSFASSTPAVDADRVYAVWNEPDHYLLTTLDHDGKQLWQRDFGPFITQHGCGSSPMLCDDKVILTDFQDDPTFVDGPKPDSRTGKSSIIAVVAKTGETAWQTPRRSTVVSYSTPCLFEPKNGARALISNSQSHGISALDPASGKVLWEYEQAFDKRSVSSPLIAGDIILGSSGSGGGGNRVVAVKAPKNSGDKPALAYEIKKSASYVPTGIIMDNLGWLWSDQGIVTCFVPGTGEIRYQERVGGNYFGSPIWVDGRLYCISKTGEMVTVEASDKFNVLNRYPLNEPCESTPTAALGRLFVRTERHLWSFGGAKESVAP